MYFKFFIICLLWCSACHAQNSFVTERILKEMMRISADLPANITEAHAHGHTIKAQLDSLQQMINAAWPALADKMKRRSARLNSMAGYNDEGATLSIIPFNQKFADYFGIEGGKMDALEKAINGVVKPFYGKSVYKIQGYIPAWDSVYKLRRPALIRYRNGIFNLVKAEIAYLKANQEMFQSSNEAERMQFVEKEATVLQKLVYLRDRLQRVIVDDGIEKVEYCKINPNVCQPGED